MTNQLEFRHFQYFLVLAETLHYRKAAEQLFISQSALSQQIQRLETIVGQPLFIRTNRKVALSQAGHFFKQEADIIIGQLDRSMERWQFRVTGGEGIIRIGFVGSAMQTYLPKIIKKFSVEYPKIKFYLEDLSNKDQMLAIERKQLDIGFIRSKPSSTTVHCRSVFKENLTLVLPKNHPIDKHHFKDMSQLAQETYILFPNEKSQMYYEQVISLCNDHGFSPQITHRSIHGPTIFKLVESGLGISIIPNSLKDEYNYQVKFIELKEVRQKTELFAVWHKENDSGVLSSFLSLLNYK